MPPSSDDLDRLLVLVKQQGTEIEKLCREIERLQKLLHSASAATKRDKTEKDSSGKETGG